jgi:general secretion pathway protein F
MPTFNYRALTAQGDIVGGAVEAASSDLVAERVQSLGLIFIDNEAPTASARTSRGARPRAEEVTIFSRDLALLLRTGAKINDALDLMANDRELGRMRAIAAELRDAVLTGQSFAESLGARPDAFPPLFVALAGLAEQTDMLPSVLEALAAERARAETLRRRIFDALRYPAFLLLAASGVLIFFLTFVLPQFAGVFADFHAKPDPVLAFFLGLSAALRENGALYAGLAFAFALALTFALRNPASRVWLVERVALVPGIRAAFAHHRTIMFCRNLALLLSGGITLSAALRILVNVMAATGAGARWSVVVDRVRRGGKLSDALSDEALLPPMAIRTLRLGEESNQLPMLARRLADYYESRLDRSIDRVVGVVGPVAIIFISAIVGGLIVSVMTALLSVNQMAG